MGAPRIFLNYSLEEVLNNSFLTWSVQVPKSQIVKFDFPPPPNLEITNDLQSFQMSKSSADF